jgi:hypothetical protein
MEHLETEEAERWSARLQNPLPGREKSNADDEEWELLQQYL